MFKKLLEKATITKKPGENPEGLRATDIEPRLVFHHGIPSGSAMFAYDSIQKILAISTKDGRIKLFGNDNTQAILESDEAVPSKFLQFMENQGILLNVTIQNCIEVWDIGKRSLSSTHIFKGDITSFTVMQKSPYMYVGDSVGNITILNLEPESCQIVQMKYTIPVSASHGSSSEIAGDTAVARILPQSTAESKRVLIIYRDGLIVLWDIRESKSIFMTSGKVLPSLNQETKTVTTACWACPFGTKVVVGYDNGDIFIWNIPSPSSQKFESPKAEELSGGQSAPVTKLNLGYKLEKMAVASIKWAYADGKASRLYVMGASDSVSTNLLQVVLLNEQTEARTIKMGLPVPEPCIDMEVISRTNEPGKNVQDMFLLLGKSGRIYAYDDHLIEKYLLQCQSKTPPPLDSLPREVAVKILSVDSSIMVAKFFTSNQYMLSFTDEDYIKLAKNTSLLPFETKQKDGNPLNSSHFTGFSKIKNIYITGHSDGAINFWDASGPIFLPVLSLKMQSEDDYSSSGIPVTALYFDGDSRLLISGDKNGMVRIFKFKPEPYASEGIFTSLQGNSKKGYNHIIHSVKLVKVNGPVLSLSKYHDSRHLAVGTDQGYVSLIDLEEASVLYEKHITSEIANGIIALQSEICSFHGFEKKVLAVATKDSSVLAFDSETGNPLSSNLIHPKKQSKALFMQILGGQSGEGPRLSNGDMGTGSPRANAIPKQELLLLCSEKAAYIYSLTHILQGIKKVHYKKTFDTSCCWATTFQAPSDVGLMLLFGNGKIEIRSLPELSLVKEISVRGYTYSSPKPSSLPNSSICASSEGEIVMVNSDQEMFIFSLLPQKETFRHLNFVSQVYNGVPIPTEALGSGPIVHKEKKKGIFNSVIKDIRGGKPKHLSMETEDTRECTEELSAIFSTANFQCATENIDTVASEDDELDLNIDDIDLDDHEEKPKEQKILGAFNKNKLASKFQAFGDKFKHIKIKNEKSSTKEEPQDEKVGATDQIKKRYGFSSSTKEEPQDEKLGAVDQIRKKYGFSSSSDPSAAATMAQSKLHENITKLQGINQKAGEMQDNAKSFSLMTKELLRGAQQDKRIS